MVYVWVTEITSDYCKELVHSMPHHLQAVMANKGGHAKY